MTRAPVWSWVWLLMLLTLIYASGVGRGFVKDDVVWVNASTVASWDDVEQLAVRTQGFYRPLVSATFALDRSLYGLKSRGFGATNFLLLVLATTALVWLGLSLGLRPAGAVVASALWALNFHGINMAVLWLSGRTALLLTLCSLLAAAAFVRKRPAIAGIGVFLALCAKEEAVMLPLIFSGWSWILTASHESTRARVKVLARDVWPSYVSLAAYLWIRSLTDAMTPATSPWFYRFVSSPGQLLENALHYVDRAGTCSAAIVLVACLVARQLPRITPDVRRAAILGGLWLLGGYAITVLLPVRSSLYACFPSVGVALFAATILQDLFTRADAAARRRLAVCSILLPLVLLPVYWARNVRWTENADLSAQTFLVLQDLTRDEPHVRAITFVDDRSTRRSFANTYGSLLPEAVKLATGRSLVTRLEPPVDDSTAAASTEANSDALVVLLNGQPNWRRR